ncbi:MAG TPA: family 43 glycosylhydrolase, partial [Vicinamibacteria bacterium]
MKSDMDRKHGARRLHEIRLRDPFVLADKEDGLYYLYGTSDPNPWHGPGSGFDAYRSSDLERWEGPFRVFEPQAGFGGEENFWAPEVHRVDGRYLMLATFRGREGRGSAVLTGPGPLGPFQPHSL